jgi:toxin-antitoxin system PIN domain toxin
LTRPALLDVNVLVALFFPSHIHHDVAHEWFADERRYGWATCPVTENGFIRVALEKAFQDPNSSIQRAAAVVEHFAAFRASGDHSFWSDTVSLADSTLFDPTNLHGPRQLTDAYRLGLAHKRRGRLVTFDQSIPIASVVGASRETVCLLARDG